jgi:hypothetical protein
VTPERLAIPPVLIESIAGSCRSLSKRKTITIPKTKICLFDAYTDGSFRPIRCTWVEVNKRLISFISVTPQPGRGKLPIIPFSRCGPEQIEFHAASGASCLRSRPAILGRQGGVFTRLPRGMRAWLTWG